MKTSESGEKWRCGTTTEEQQEKIEKLNQYYKDKNIKFAEQQFW